jgi:hypothetical protein
MNVGDQGIAGRKGWKGGREGGRVLENLKQTN